MLESSLNEYIDGAGAVPGQCRGDNGIVHGRFRGDAGAVPGWCRGGAGAVPELFYYMVFFL